MSQTHLSTFDHNHGHKRIIVYELNANSMGRHQLALKQEVLSRSKMFFSQTALISQDPETN